MDEIKNSFESSKENQLCYGIMQGDPILKMKNGIQMIGFKVEA